MVNYTAVSRLSKGESDSCPSFKANVTGGENFNSLEKVCIHSIFKNLENIGFCNIIVKIYSKAYVKNIV